MFVGLLVWHMFVGLLVRSTNKILKIFPYIYIYIFIYIYMFIYLFVTISHLTHYVSNRKGPSLVNQPK